MVAQVCGLQAQDAPAATLGVRPRAAGLVATDVERARTQERSVVRTWAMRGTLHLVAREDLGWLLPLLGPVFVRASLRRYAELGLDEETSARGLRAIRDVLAGQGPLTRVEMVERLAVRGLRLEGQATPHLIRRAALEGMICLGPQRGARPTYVLLDDWTDRAPAVSREGAQAELARRYLEAYGPAGPDDLAAWSGLPMGEVRAGWQRVADQLIEVEAAGRPAWMLKARAAWLDEPTTHLAQVRLLPSFDTYLLGYRSRDLTVPPEHAKRINAGAGWLHPTLLVDGRAVATWRSKRRRDGLDVVVEPFDGLAADVHSGVEAEVADLERFLGVKATFSVVPSVNSVAVDDAGVGR